MQFSEYYTAGPRKYSTIRNSIFSNVNLQFAISVFLLLISIISTTQILCAADQVAVPLEDRPFPGELISIDSKGQAAFVSAGKKRQVPLSNLVLWGNCPEPKRDPIFILADGSCLTAEIISSDKETISVECDIFGRLKIPWDAIAGAVFSLPRASKDRDAILDRILKSEDQSDRLFLENGDEPAGIIDNIGDNTVSLKTNAGTLKIDSSRIAAIIFNSALRRKTTGNANGTWLGFSDGSRIFAESVILDASGLLFDAAGQTLKTSPKNLVFLQPLSGRAVYLSDLKPDVYRFTPFLDLTWPYKLDRNVTGSHLRAGGNLYLKGIGLHSAARLTYNLDQPYKQFQSDLAVDDSTDGGGSVRFHVFVDGVEKFSSEIIRGGMKPVSIVVDLSGAKIIELQVDYADRADVLDHADWLNARLIK
jgi:hypothetical protein